MSNSATSPGVVVGGPPFAVVSLRWPRRTALVLTQLVFAACIAGGLIIGSYPALLITRFVAGLAYAGFFAVAAVTAVSLVPPDRAARASGVVVSGLSLAMILGGPAGTLIGYRTSWEGGFWAVVALTLAAAAAVTTAMPRTDAAPDLSIERELRTMRQPHLWLVYSVTLLSTAAYMVTFNYLAELLDRVTGIPDEWIAAVLMLFGVGAYLGLAIGGRIADRRPHHAMVAGFVLNPALYGRVFSIASDAPTLAGATTVSAFQLGISLVPLLAGLALRADAPITTVAWIGAGLAAVTIPLVLVGRSAVQPTTRRR